MNGRTAGRGRPAQTGGLPHFGAKIGLSGMSGGDDDLRRVRGICLSMPEAEERVSHGEPTFFVRKKVFVMFANNHHNDGHIAIWIPAAPGVQEMLIQTLPEAYFKPPYVGVRGWVGVELGRIGDAELAIHVRDAWRMIAPKRLR